MIAHAQLSQLPDSELCRMAGRDSKSPAWEVMYDRYKNAVYRVAQKHSSGDGTKRYDRDECLSNAHRTFMHCVRNFDESREAKFITYLIASLERARPGEFAGPIKVTRRAIKNNGKVAYAALSAKQLTISNDDSDRPELMASTEQTPCEIAAEKEERNRKVAMVDAYLSYLSPRPRDMVRLRYIEGMTFRQIAERYNCSRQNVQLIVNCALRELSKWAAITTSKGTDTTARANSDGNAAGADSRRMPTTESDARIPVFPLALINGLKRCLVPAGLFAKLRRKLESVRKPCRAAGHLPRRQPCESRQAEVGVFTAENR